MSRRAVRTAFAALAVASPLVLGACAEGEEGGAGEGGVVEQEGEGGEGEGGEDEGGDY
jgi:hypothetical protein